MMNELSSSQPSSSSLSSATATALSLQESSANWIEIDPVVIPPNDFSTSMTTSRPTTASTSLINQINQGEQGREQPPASVHMKSDVDIDLDIDIDMLNL